MTTEPDWERLDALFHAALEQPASERAAFVAAACGVDQALRQRLEALLAADAEPDDPLAAVVADAAQALDTRVTDELSGRRIGAFRVGPEIGRGGMGAVYLAERDDESFAQRVALKVIRVGASAPSARARFLRERQILAALQHPGIARLVDGGVTDDGHPWFAMEFVEGERIDRWCERTKASLGTRLRLFDEACRAIAYAHAQLVVHRDLKPEHLLVTAEGDVRVLDFGIAKALVDDPAPEGGSGTPAGASTVTNLLRGMPMTPAYASPEQARGEPVGTATDIYALGVILYELLTGGRPYDVRDATPETLADVIHRATPVPPSGRTGETPVPRRRLSGDLDAICLKALAKDPAQRYATVDALRDDLARFAARRPVRARGDSLAYRVQTLLRRAPAASAIAIVAVSTIIGVTALYTRRLATERDLARREATRANEVATFLRTLFAVADPVTVRGDTITVRTVLDRGAARIDSSLVSQPRLRADLTELLAGAFLGLGLPARAESLLVSTLALRTAHPETTPLELATTEQSLGAALQDLGEIDRALSYFRASVARLEGAPTASPAAHAEAVLGLAFALETSGDQDSAIVRYREGLAIVDGLAPDDPSRAYAEARLGGMLRRERAFDEAEPLLRHALAVQQATYGEPHSRVASTMRNLAALLRDTRQFAESDSLYQRAIAMRRALLGDAHPDVLTSLNSYANLLFEMGAIDRAVAIYEELERASVAAYGPAHPSLAAIANNYAIALRSMGRLNEAAAAFRRAIDVSAATLPPGHANRAHGIIGLGRVRRDQGRLDESAQLIREAIAIRRAALSPGHRDLGDALSDLGETLTRQRQFPDAEAALVEAHDILLASEGAASGRVTAVRERAAALYREWSRPADVRRVPPPR